MKKRRLAFTFGMMLFGGSPLALASIWLYFYLSHAPEARGWFLEGMFGAWCMLSVIGIALTAKSYVARLSKDGVKEWPWSRTIPWKEIDSVTTLRFPLGGFFDVVEIRSGGREIRLSLGMYEDSQAAVGAVQRWYPRTDKDN